MKDSSFNINAVQSDSLFNQISNVLSNARSLVAVTVNTAMVEAYWNIGSLIVEAQGGKNNSTYGDRLIKSISRRMTDSFGKGFSERNLRNMRQFFLTFPIWQTVSAKLSWSHYLLIMRVENPKARQYYIREASEGGWSVRQLERQICTQYYDRLLASHHSDNKINEIPANKLIANNGTYNPLELIHDPFVLEFLDIKEDPSLQEKELEAAILTHIEDFLLELGRGFAFVGRQKRFTLENDHFYPDLVFYNITARCYIIIDLKMGKASYADVGQMQLYVNYFNREVCGKDDNPTVGIILCAEKNDTVIEYTLGNRTDISVFASRYKLILPTEEELRREIEKTKENFRRLKE